MRGNATGKMVNKWSTNLQKGRKKQKTLKQDKPLQALKIQGFSEN